MLFTKVKVSILKDQSLISKNLLFLLKDYILKKEKGEFFAYLTQKNNCITKLKLVAVITNIILETKK